MYSPCRHQLRLSVFNIGEYKGVVMPEMGYISGVFGEWLKSNDGHIVYNELYVCRLNQSSKSSSLALAAASVRLPTPNLP